MFKFREICEVKPRERNLTGLGNVDPDKLINPDERVEEIVEECERLSDEVWDRTFDPDKLIGS